MKYLKKYESIEWEFYEEEIDKISNDTFYIYLFRFEDEYSYELNDRKFRILLCLEENDIAYIIKNIINDKIYYNNGYTGDNRYSGNFTLINEIKNGDYWITPPYETNSNLFKKWRFSELDSLLNISDDIIYIF